MEKRIIMLEPAALARLVLLIGATPTNIHHARNGVAPTDADKGSLCRVKDDANSEWYESRFLVTDNGKFLAKRDEDSYAYPYDFCEVLD
jgi:hypothetical protein